MTTQHTTNTAANSTATGADPTPDRGHDRRALRTLDELAAALDGRLSRPGDADWDQTRAAWQLLVDQHPDAVVVAASAGDVVLTVRAARTLGMRVAPQATGHAAGAIPSLENTILLHTGELTGVSVDPTAMTARVEAGVVWRDVVRVAAQHGLAAVTGMSADVGVVGFLLGGGLGWLGRSHGLGSNSLVAADAVDASGRVIRIDPQHNEDLWWAMRGGVAPVIVTAVEFRLYPIAEVYGGALLWPIERAADVAHAWREWIAHIPPSVTSLARVLRYPPLPELPAFLRGRSFVAVEAAIQEDAPTAELMLQELRALTPEFDLMRPMSPSELGSVHGDPQQPAPAFGGSVLLTEITAESVDAFLDGALSADSQSLLSAELRHLGGDLSPQRGEGGALNSIPAAGLIFCVGMVPFPEALEPVRAGVAAMASSVKRFASPRAFRNFCDDPADPRALYGEAIERIRRIARDWDPQNAIVLGHELR